MSAELIDSVFLKRFIKLSKQTRAIVRSASTRWRRKQQRDSSRIVVHVGLRGWREGSKGFLPPTTKRFQFAGKCRRKPTLNPPPETLRIGCLARRRRMRKVHEPRARSEHFSRYFCVHAHFRSSSLILYGRRYRSKFSRNALKHHRLRGIGGGEMRRRIN